MSLKGIREKLDLLRKRDVGLTVFGAADHCYELVPPLTESEAEEVESQFGVRFPKEYRQFLLEVGAGGAGPFYGLFPLVKTDGGWKWEGDGAEMVADLTKPFPHTKEWNLDGHPIWNEAPDEDDEKFDSESFEEACEEWEDRFYEIYWNAEWTPGAICLCHLGCATRHWLVVTGPERGNMWLDDTANDEGVIPLKKGDPDQGGWTDLSDDPKERLSFAAWYEGWLDESLK